MSRLPETVFTQLLTPNGFDQWEPILGGLSSSGVWSCSGGGRRSVLRSWPVEQRSVQSLRALHEQLGLLTQAGFHFTPRVYSSRDGQSVLAADGSLWDLVSWLDGRATYCENPSPAKLEAAVRGVAAIHRIWRTETQVGPSPTIQNRIQRLEKWLQFAANPVPPRSNSISSAEQQMLNHSLALLIQFGSHLASDLKEMEKKYVNLHFAIRDCHSDHFLFTGEQLSGIIDFGAARHDEPLTDLVRLLGTLEPDSSERYRHCLEIYRSEMNCRSLDWNRFQLMDCAATLLSSLQWTDWLALHPIEFQETREDYVHRWQRLTRRADRLLHERYS